MVVCECLAPDGASVLQADQQRTDEDADSAFVIQSSLPITGQVYERLRRAILTNRLAPGTLLSEKDLSVRFGVSRTPCRESLIRLAEEGLVTVYAQRGTIVAPINAEGVTQAQFIREALEVAVIGQLATTAPPPNLEAVRALLDRQHEVAGARDYERFFELDEAFHRELCVQAGRAPVWKLIAEVKTQLDRVRYLSLPDPLRIGQILAEHEAILAAVAAADTAAAVRAMRHHLRAVLGSLGTLPAMAASAPRRGA